MANGTFGMGKADPSLVEAGFRLGKSNIPGDHSKIFAKQYEGLIKAKQAEMMGAALKGQAINQSISKGIKWASDYAEADKQERELVQGIVNDTERQLETVGDGFTEGVISKNAAELMEGGSSSEIHVNPAQKYLQGLADQWGQLNKKRVFKSSKDKKLQQKLMQQIQEFRPTLVKNKAKRTSLLGLWTTGGIDKVGSFKGEPNLKQLWTLTMDKSMTEGNLAEIGVKGYWNNGKKYYDYPDGLLGGTYGSITNGGPDGINVTPAEFKETHTISEEDLLARLKPIDKGTIETTGGIGNQVLENVNQELKDRNGNKYYSVKSFDEIKGKVQSDFATAFGRSTNISHLANENIWVGNQELNFRQSYKKDRVINDIILTTVGIGSDEIKKLDTMPPFGSIGPEDKPTDADELKKHENALDEILEMFTNPKDQKGIEGLANEMANYRTNMLGIEFNKQRKQHDPLNPNN